MENHEKSEAPPVRIGLMAPLTGLADMYGQEISWAGRIACREINEQGGVLGRPLELIVVDDGSLPKTAVAAAEQLVDEYGCTAIIGTLLSNSRISVAHRVAEPRRIPYLNFSFYEGSISGRYFFHFAALPNQQIDRMITYAAAHFGPKMYFAGANYEWPRGSIDAAKQALLRVGGEVVGEEYFEMGGRNFGDLMQRVANSGADVFVPYGAGSDQIALLLQFWEFGLKDRMSVFMGHFDEVMASRLPPEVRDGLFSCNTYFMSLDTPLNRAYLERVGALPEVSGIWPLGNGVVTHFGEAAALCVHAFANAANTAGSLDSERLVRALERVAVEGPQGTVAMDPDTHHAAVNVYLARCRVDGGFDVIESFGRIEPVIPERYRQCSAPALAAGEVCTIPGCVVKEEILEHVDDAILAVNPRGVIVFANQTAGEMFGYDPGEMVGMQLHALLPPHLRGMHGQQTHAFFESDQAKRSMKSRNVLTGYRKDGHFIDVEISLSKAKIPEGAIVVATLRNAVERRRVETELQWHASHDTLTGLPNRVLIQDRLGNALARSQRTGQQIVLMFLDIDVFKLVNDNYGHAVGDELLKAIGARLVQSVRPGDTVGRFGGDEFLVMCDQLSEGMVAASLAERVVDSFRQPFVIGPNEIYATVSVGLAIGTGSSDSVDTLLRYADAAMHRAKESGRNCWRIFDHKIGAQMKTQLDIGTGLRKALENGELSLDYQPITSIASRKIAGVEALLRWRPPSGPISPAVFIPIAEVNGLILPIGQWVLEQACETLGQWSRGVAPEKLPYMSINVSARQLDMTRLPHNLSDILGRTGVSPNQVVLEVTETALTADVERAARILREVAEMGVRIAVDDFGTGFASLSQLMQLPVNVLKVDRVFINGVDEERRKLVMTSAIINMAHTLGLQVTAEGVETEEQMRVITAFGCDYAQGFLLHRPMGSEQLLSLLK